MVTSQDQHLPPLLETVTAINNAAAEASQLERITTVIEGVLSEATLLPDDDWAATPDTIQAFIRQSLAELATAIGFAPDEEAEPVVQRESREQREVIGDLEVLREVQRTGKHVDVTYYTRPATGMGAFEETEND